MPKSHSIVLTEWETGLLKMPGER